MSLVGQKATSRGDPATSACPPAQGAPQVRFVPKATLGLAVPDHRIAYK
jgi:hypothetical protein